MDTLKSEAGGGKTVRRLDEFPDLVEALRNGDLLTGQLFCARLFGLDSRRSSQVREQASVLSDPAGNSRRTEICAGVSKASG